MGGPSRRWPQMCALDKFSVQLVGGTCHWLHWRVKYASYRQVFLLAFKLHHWLWRLKTLDSVLHCLGIGFSAPLKSFHSCSGPVLATQLHHVQTALSFLHPGKVSFTLDEVSFILMAGKQGQLLVMWVCFLFWKLLCASGRKQIWQQPPYSELSWLICN